MSELNIHDESCVRALEDRSDAVRREALEALSRSENPRVAVALALHALRRSVSATESLTAVRAILCVRDVASRRFALALLASHPEPSIRRVSQRLRKVA